VWRVAAYIYDYISIYSSVHIHPDPQGGSRGMLTSGQHRVCGFFSSY
jgi:hypothetical protein